MTKITYEVGGTIEARGAICRIIKVYPFGTVDVIHPNGRAYRITGLPIYEL